MKKLKISLFIVIIIAVLALPVIIYANNANIEVEDLIDRVIIGSAVFQVEKEKTREERLKEKYEIAEKYKNDKSIVKEEYSSQSNSNQKEKVIIRKEGISNRGQELEQELNKIAEKYNRKEELEDITNILSRKGQTSQFTNEHKKLCKLFLEIYTNEKITEDEEKIFKEFFEMIEFNDIDNELRNEIQKVIN